MVGLHLRHDAFFETRDAITRFLFLKNEPASVDLCFVLGCPDVTTMQPAIALHLKGLTPRILISGHGPSPREEPEAEIFKRYALGHGIPAAAILMELQAFNTLENFILSRAVIAKEIGWENIRTVAIVGKPFHMRRALMTARMHWPARLHFLMLPSDRPDDPSAESWWKSERGRRYVFSELEAIGRYALLGHIGGV